MTLQKARLTIDADVDGDGSKETGVFEMAGNMDLSPGERTGYLIGGRGSNINAVFSSTFAEGNSKKKGVHLNLGGGARTVGLQFWVWEGSSFQWGNDANKGKTEASATGQDPLTQIDVLVRYITVGEIDSRNPAKLEYGEYSDSGLYEPMDVVIEEPQLTRTAQDGSWATGQMTCVSTVDINSILHGQQRTG